MNKIGEKIIKNEQNRSKMNKIGEKIIKNEQNRLKTH